MNDATPLTNPRSTHGESTHFDLRAALALVQERWIWVVVITSLITLVALAYALLSTPIFQTNALVQVEDKNSGMSGLGDLSSVLTGQTPTEAEIEIVRSRAVLGAAVEREKLYLRATPRYLPVIGAALARRYSGKGQAEPLFGLKQYAWGGERIKIDRLDLPRGLYGQQLTLVKGEGDSFQLWYDDTVLLDGVVGKAGEQNSVAAFVSQLEARPGTKFHVVRRNWLNTLQSLSGRLTVSERGKQTGILEIVLRGTSPTRIAETLNTIAEIYLRQNVERTSEDAAKTLEFLDEQLPALKDQLDGAEFALNQYRIREGTVDLTLETQALLETLGEVESQLSALELKQAELGQRFTAEHPVRMAIDQQRMELEANREQMELQIRQLPEAEQDSVRLMRDVRVANELYMLLLNRAQELKVVRAGTVGNIRIIDEAYVPLRPIKPRRSLVVSMGLILGLMVSLITIFLREAMNSEISDPDELEKIGELPVYATVPHSDREQDLNAALSSKGGHGQLLLSAQSDDIAIESLRSLRTSLEFLLLDADPRIVAIGGPAPGAGKSFVTANLAALFAQAGKRTLLIDADLRRGHLHRLFGQQRGDGLVDLIAGTPAERIIRSGLLPGLDFISTGIIPPNPSELITSPRFARLLAEFSSEYDIVLMDAPPVLGAAEAMTLARLASISLLVVRSDQQTPREVQMALSKLRQSGAQTNGFVLNDFKARARHSYQRYHYYRYHQT